jgi:hypothetical protein
VSHQQVIGSMRLWAILTRSVALIWSDFGQPGGHRQHPFSGKFGQFYNIGITCVFAEMGQLDAIGSTTSEQLWAISKSSAVSDYGPTPCHWYRLFKMTAGHQEAIDGICFEGSLANFMTLASPTSFQRWAIGSIQLEELGQFHAIGITYVFSEMGQLEAIGSTASEQLWAISKSLAVSDYGPTPCYRYHLFKVAAGHQEAIGSIYFEGSLANSMTSASPTSFQRWANSMLLTAPLQSNCGPSASHQQYLIMGQHHAIGIASLK